MQSLWRPPINLVSPCGAEQFQPNLEAPLTTIGVKEEPQITVHSKTPVSQALAAFGFSTKRTW